MTLSIWPLNTWVQRPVLTSHIQILFKSQPDTIRVDFKLKDIEWIDDLFKLYNLWRFDYVLVSHMKMQSSCSDCAGLISLINICLPIAAIYLPFGLNVAQLKVFCSDSLIVLRHS